MERSDSAGVVAIESTLKEMAEAYVARDWDGFTSFFTDDGVWMPPGQPALIGKDAWWSWIGGGWAESTIQRLNSISEEIVIAGDWAYEWHNETHVGQDYERKFTGIFILHRQSSGSWKVARYCFNLAQ